MRPERCWPRRAGVIQWTGMPHGGRVGGPELPHCRCVSSADGWAWPVECPRSSAVRLRGPAGRRLIAKPRPRLPIAAAAR